MARPRRKTRAEKVQGNEQKPAMSKYQARMARRFIDVEEAE